MRNIEALKSKMRHKAESSWGRIVQHIEGESTFAAISAYASGFSDKVNAERHDQLRKDIRDMGYGYIEVDSGYTYFDKRGKEAQSTEEAFFIPEISLEDALHLAQKYDQESFLWKDRKQFVEMTSDGRVNMEFQMERGDDGQITFDPETLKIAFSQLRKATKNQQRKFAFRAESRSFRKADISGLEIWAYAEPTLMDAYGRQKSGIPPSAMRFGLTEYMRNYAKGKQYRSERDRQFAQKRTKQEKKRVGSVAFWVKGDEVLETDAAHIRYIQNNPAKFGLSAEDLQDAYDRHGEKPGSEGEARNEIIKMVARNGWVRVRHYVNKGNDYWSIQVDELRRRKKSVDNFIMWALENEYMSMNDELVIVGYDSNEVYRYGFMEGGVKAYLEEKDISRRAEKLYETPKPDQIYL